MKPESIKLPCGYTLTKLPRGHTGPIICECGEAGAVWTVSLPSGEAIAYASTCLECASAFAEEIAREAERSA